MIRHLINFSGNLMEWYVCVCFFSSLHRRRFSKWLTVLLGAGFTLLQFLNTELFLMESSFVVVGMAIYAFLLSLLYDAKWYWKLLESVFICAVLAIAEIALGAAEVLLLKIDIAYSQENLVLFAICTITTKLMALFVVWLFRVGRVRRLTRAPWYIVLPAVFLPMATVSVGMIMTQAGTIIRESSFHVLTIVAMVLMMLASFVSFWVIERQEDYIRTKESLRYAQAHIRHQVDHYRDLYQYQKEIRQARHDMKHKLLAVLGLLQAGETEKARRFIDEELAQADRAAEEIVNSGDPVLDAVLQSKLRAAKENGVAFDLEILPQAPIRINELELGVLFGNAADNAIEAAKRSGVPQPTVRVTIKPTETRIWMSMENPTAEESGTPVRGVAAQSDPRHGFGLQSIRSIVERYDGSISVTWVDHRFLLEIGLENRE